MTLGRRSVAWIGGSFIAAMVAFTGYGILRTYHAALADTGRELDIQARIIAEQTARSLQAVDFVLRHLAQQFQQGALNALTAEELHAYLREQAVGLVQADGLLMIQASGLPRATSLVHPVPEPAPNVSNFAVFQALRANRGLGLVIDTAVQSAVDRQWIFPMVRRLETPAGEFAGVVAARGRIDYFERFYRNVRLDPATTVVLMQQNGTLLARHPPVESALGKRFPLFDEMLAVHTGPVRSVSPIDGVERFAVLKLVPDYPLAVIVTRDAAAALAPWRAQSIGSAIRTLALSGLAAGLLVLLLRQLSRLHTTQERYALAVAGSDDGVWDFDFANKRVFASARARELSGLPPGPEMQPMDEWFASLPIHPEDAPRRIAAMEAHMAGATPAYEGEFRLRHPDGNYRWVRVHGLCTRDGAGRPHRMAGSISDIDARKRAENSLRESEERFALAVAGSNDGIVDWDVVNDRMYSSERAMQIVGIESAVTVRSRSEWRELVKYHPDDVERLQQALRDFLEGRSELRDGEYRVRLAEGSYRWIRHRNKCVRDAAGRPLRVAGSVSDIDAQKRAEEALRASEEQYRAIFNAAADALVLRDAEARVVDVNPAFLQISGYTREEVVDESRWIFALPEASELAREMHRRVIAGESVHFEIQARRKDGRRIDVEMRAVPIRYRGQPHALGMARDITAQKQAAAERTRLEGQLLQAKKLEAIGTLAGGIAHDFNNILAAILGYGEMAQKNAPAGSALRRHIDAVVAAGMRAKSLVERILAFSRSGIGERVPVHVQSVVTEALDLAAASLPGHVQLERRLAAGDAAVMGDPTQIHQVVMNLCANGAQAMKSKGTLTVSLDVVQRDDAMAATSRLAAGRYVRLSVRDTGSGIAPNVLERIFDPFFTTRQVGVGTGLGLSLVHGIVTDLGGGIDVESKPGAGATFTIYLPWSSAAAVASTSEEHVPGGNGETILLVDDEEPLVRLGEEMIASLGYEPVGFTSSAAALEAFREAPERFHAVLSDEAMPDLTGADLAKAIRAIRPDVPIVLMSGLVSPLFAARARNIGVVEVLAKPLVAGDIARSLAVALRKTTGSVL